MQFDYGNDNQNIAHYGSTNVPLIPLENIPETMNIATFAGLQDSLADQTDVIWLIDYLNVRIVHHENIDQFDHLSFVFGKNMTYTSKVINLINKY